jgi:hypothetical protein
MMLSVSARSGALSTSVPSRSKTTVGATIIRDRYRVMRAMARLGLMRVRWRMDYALALKGAR